MHLDTIYPLSHQKETCHWCSGNLSKIRNIYKGQDSQRHYCNSMCLVKGEERALRYKVAGAGFQSPWWIIPLGFIIAISAGLFFPTKAKAFEWPKEFAITSIACIDSNDAHSILLTHKVKDLASAQGKYQELVADSLCLNGNYFGTFVKVVHEVKDLDFGTMKANGFVVEMDANGHQFFLLVMRRVEPDRET